MQITIDFEFQSLIPPLSPQEYQQLEANLLADGCRDPLVLWGEILIDGHNRYKICQEHSLPFQIVDVEFNNRSDALLWIVKNQMGRRNLTDVARVEMARYLRPVFEAMARENFGKRTDLRPNSDEGLSYIRVDDELAALAGMGRDKFRKIETVLDQPDGPIKEQLRRGDVSAHAAFKEVKKEQRVAEKESIRQNQAAIGSSADLPHNIQLHHADFTTWCESNIEPNSIDVIFTDPPYHERYLHLWEHLGAIAATVLKPHGLLIAYSGQSFLPQVLTAVGNHLDYVWTIATYHNGGYGQIWKPQVINAWKPIIIWAKNGYEPRLWFTDFLKDGEREKDLHDWAQPIGEARHLIGLFTEPNQTLLDPMMGSGTIPLAAMQHGNLNVIGIEVEQENFLVAKGRIHDSRLSE